MNGKSPTIINDVPLGQPGLVEQMKSQAESTSETAPPQRAMTDQHRSHLSQSMKKLWTRRRGLSSEHRRKISASVKKQWAERGRMTVDTVNNQRRLPDPEICRTAFGEGVPVFSFCMVHTPDGCRHTSRLGSFVLCLHPDRRKFEKAEKTS